MTKNGLLRRFRLRSLSYGGQVVPRNDDKIQIRIPAARYPRVVQESLAQDRGRRESRVPVAPAASRAIKKKAHERSHHRFTGITRPSLRNGFNGLLRALPGDRAFLPPSSADTSANLTPASGRQDHTTSPYARKRPR